MYKNVFHHHEIQIHFRRTRRYRNICIGNDECFSAARTAPMKKKWLIKIALSSLGGCHKYELQLNLRSDLQIVNTECRSHDIAPSKFIQLLYVFRQFCENEIFGPGELKPIYRAQFSIPWILASFTLWRILQTQTDSTDNDLPRDTIRVTAAMRCDLTKLANNLSAYCHCSC